MISNKVDESLQRNTDEIFIKIAASLVECNDFI